MSLEEFALPDLGEGLTESEVVAWRVAVGERVELNQIVAEVETAKALVEVPSPFAGVVRGLHAEPGETLRVGAPLMSFDVDGAETDPAQTDDSESAVEQDRVAEPVGAGVAANARVGSASSASASPGGAPTRPVVSHDEPRPRVRGESQSGGRSATTGEERHEVLVGRGPREQSTDRPRRRSRSGRLAEPVARQRAFAVRLSSDRPARAGGSGTSGERAETRAPATGVRRRTAEAMVRSAAVPQVTEFLTVDVTRSIRLLERLAGAPEFRDTRVTVLTLAAKALCLALSATPDANARWDDASGEIVTPAAVNLGIAVATERGLVVPNIRSADALRMPELAKALSALVERARGGRCTPAELTGGTITITNVGVFGVDSGTPLLNPGETAILALGAVNRRPWEHKGAVALRHVATLSLTFDHRVIDGEQGSRLLRDVGRALADPAVALAAG